MANNQYRKIMLNEESIPTNWYNVQHDLPTAVAPPLHPVTHEPISPDDLSAIFPMPLIEQEVSTEAEIAIPLEVREKLGLWRPTPLVRARGLEAALGTPAKIFYKNESVSPPGSHKPNTALAQAFYNKEAGVKGLCTETGAGQWGSALAFACAQFGLSCKVFMVKASYEQKPYRRTMMETWGGTCTPSPSLETAAGRGILEKDPNCTGSLGIAISEAVEIAMNAPELNYSLGSVLNHVLLHQTVIGLEAKQQLKMVGEKADVVIGCVGGGSNFGGLSLPFARDAINGDPVRLIAVEPESCPTLTRGPYTYDFGDTAHLTPLLAMHTLGHGFIPEPIHAGGLRYHGMAPIVSRIVKDGIAQAIAVDQLETFEAGLLFAKTEGFIPAPETCHAIAAAIREAKSAKNAAKEKTIVFSFSGHGLIDMTAYSAYLEGSLEKHSLDEETLAKAARDLDGLPKP